MATLGLRGAWKHSAMLWTKTFWAFAIVHRAESRRCTVADSCVNHLTDQAGTSRHHWFGRRSKLT
jgi:hypothetical protein